MGPIEIGLLALALAIDAFSVGAVVGARSCTPRQIFRLSFHFGLFQALLPLAGAAGGRQLISWIGRYDRFVAFGLLLIIGSKMIIESLRRGPADPECEAPDATRGLRLIGLSLAVSIDALGAGVSMAMRLGWSDLLWSALVIGLVAAGGTWLGMRLGDAFLARRGRFIEVFGGLVLLGLGVKMLLD